MLTEMNERTYTKRRRAEQEAETRRRIVEATMALHEEVGPRETSISAVAERAGVQRLTVYRHFPDDFALFQACTSSWLERNPPPAADKWSGGRSPADTTRQALVAIYRYYRRTAPMWNVAYRDLELVPALEGPMAEFHAYLDSVRDQLVDLWGTEGARRRRLRATLGHLLRFTSWQTQKEQGMRDPEMARSGAIWAKALAEAPQGRGR